MERLSEFVNEVFMEIGLVKNGKIDPIYGTEG